MSLLSKFLQHGRLLSVLVGLLVMAAVPAQASRVTVLQRNGDFTILPSGEVLVVETWEVQFQGGPFHFAYRYIPLHHVDNITGWAVRENEQAYAPASSEGANTFKVEAEAGQQKITWYFPDTTDQTRVFVLSYTLHGALRLESQGDEFYWKFIEVGRDYDIQAAHAVVHLPTTFAPAQLQVRSYQNTVEKAEATILDGATVMWTSGALAPAVEWEIRVGFPHGLIEAQPPHWQSQPESRPGTTPANNNDFERLVLGLLPLLFFGGLAVWLVRQMFKVRDNPNGEGWIGGTFDGGSGGGDGGGGGGDGGGGGGSGFG